MNVPNSKEHVAMTIEVLKDFQIETTEEQRKEMLSLSTEIAVDRYKMNLIKEKLYKN